MFYMHAPSPPSPLTLGTLRACVGEGGGERMGTCPKKNKSGRHPARVEEKSLLRVKNPLRGSRIPAPMPLEWRTYIPSHPYEKNLSRAPGERGKKKEEE